jgi:multidrug efflux pump subunit AcrA (membrane-fusion protein)
VARVEPVADPGTRQLGVWVRLPNDDGSLVGGLFARGRILTGEECEVVTVPTGAVRGTDADAHVLVVADGRVKAVAVTVGEVDASRGIATVTSGLVGGETVVVAPGTVEDGTPVKVGDDERIADVDTAGSDR